jgi:hypothetical protein
VKRSLGASVASLLLVVDACGANDGGGASGLSAPGDPAVWMLAEQIESLGMKPVPDEDITTATTSFVAQVMRFGCSDGVTGRVLEPTVTWSDTQVVITFTVEALPTDRAYTCPGNDVVPVGIDLVRPIGNRVLVDGACASGRDAATGAWCIDDSGVRWTPTSE